MVAALVAGVLFLPAALARREQHPRAVTAARPASFTFVAGRRTLAVVGDRDIRRLGLARAVRRALPARRRERLGYGTVTVALDRAAALRRAAAHRGGGVVAVPLRPVASRIPAPVVGQRLRNDCEATALGILLAATGVRVDQLALQARLPTSGPLDPRTSGGDEVWGDPELGFVGRADGGGTAGGFGVYQRPVASAALHYGRRLSDETGSTVRQLMGRLLRGHPVMAWVGLSAGPYGDWRSPAGRRVHVDFGEHTVVLAGVQADGRLVVVNPLQGTRELWSRHGFRVMWDRLGRRALSA